MKVTKLNCAACGAPISVPEGLDSINCASCGTLLGIERGEGYIVSKIGEKISQTIEETGHETHEAIRENTQVTRIELQRLQLANELSTARVELSSIQSEIRMLERSQPTITLNEQLLALHTNEYQILDRIRLLTKQVSPPKTGDFSENIKFLEWEISWLNLEIAALTKSNYPQSNQKIQKFNFLKQQYTQDVIKYMAYDLEVRLQSFKVDDPPFDDQAKITALLELLAADEMKIKDKRNSPEGKIVYQKIIQRIKKFEPFVELQSRNYFSNSEIPLDIQTDGSNLNATADGDNKILRNGCLFGLLVLLGFCCIGATILGVFFDESANETLTFSVFLIVMTIGFGLGSYVFLQRVSPTIRIRGFGFIPDFVIKSKNRVNVIRNTRLIKTLMAIISCIFIYIFAFTISVTADPSVGSVAVAIFMIGLILGPLAAILVWRRTIIHYL